MLRPLSRAIPVMANQGSQGNRQFCNPSHTITDIGQKLGLNLSQGEVNQLAQAIAAGGQRGMAVALSIADSIAEANYQLTPQLVTGLMNTLNQGSHQGLQFSLLAKARLSKIHIRR